MPYNAPAARAARWIFAGAPDWAGTMGGQASEAITIRAYRADDREAVLALAPRLAVGIAPWRSEAGMLAAARRSVVEAIDGSSAERAAYVAAEPNGTVVGFADVAVETHFTGERQAYLGTLMVAASA